MRSLIQFFINRSFTVNVISLGVILLGLLGWLSLKRDLHPPFSFNNINVSVSLPGASSTEMEELVARPIEEELSGLPDVKKMTTSIRPGSVTLSIVYPADIENMLERVEEVRSRTESIRSDLPGNVKTISVNQDKVESLFLSHMVLKNIDVENPLHRSWGERIERELEKVPGVASVDMDMPGRALVIRPNLKELERLDIAWSSIGHAIEKYLGSTPLGSIDQDEKSYQLQIPRGKASLEDLRQVPILANRSGQSLLLGEVATLEYRIHKSKEMFLYNGVEGISISITKAISADALITSEKLAQAVARLQSQLPAPLAMEEAFSTTQFIQQQLDVLIGNGLQGLVLVLIVLIVFLDRRSAFLVAFGIPLSYAGSFLALWAMGLSLDLISMIGLILVVGVLVDDAIIVSERYIRLLEDGLPPVEAATEAARQLIVPVTGTIHTTIVAFIPIILIKSEMSVILLAIPIVVMSCLVVSWLETFFVLPNHLAHYIPQVTALPAQRFWQLASNTYHNILKFSLKARYLFLPLYLGLFIYTLYFGSQKLAQNFQFGAGVEQVQVFVDLKNSPSLAHTKQMLAPLLAMAEQLPKDQVKSYSTDIGGYWREGQEKNGFRFARMTVALRHDISNAKKVRAQIKERLENEVKVMDQKNFESILVEERKRGAEKQKESLVAVQLESASGSTLIALKSEIRKKLENQGAIKSLKDDLAELNSFDLSFIPDLKELSRHGLDYSGLAQNIQLYFMPYEIAELRDEQGRFSVDLEFADTEKITADEAKTIKIFNQQNLLIDSNQLGRWEQSQVPADLTREGGLRKMQLDFEFDEAKMALPEMKNYIEKELSALKEKYPQVKISATDADEWETENRGWAMRVLALGLGLIFMVLVLDLQSFVSPFFIFSSITYSLVGIIWALYAHDMNINIMVMIGIVGCAGVAVNDSIVMVSRIQELWDQGMDKRMAIVEGAKERLRPIFLTWITTIVGVIPTAYGLGSEAGFTAPLAFSMLWGLLSAAVFNLTLIPALLASWIDGQDRARKWLKSGSGGNGEAISFWPKILRPSFYRQ